MYRLVTVIVVGADVINMFACADIFIGVSGFVGSANLHVVAVDAVTRRSRASCPAEVDVAATNLQTKVGRLGGLSEDGVNNCQSISTASTSIVVFGYSVIRRNGRSLQ